MLTDKSSFAILLVVGFLTFAEFLSWAMASGPSPCLIQPEHSQQSANHDKHEDCPTFFAGTLLFFERGVDILKRDDNDKAVVAGFTIVLAISTILLWLATFDLNQTTLRVAEGNERQFLATQRAFIAGSFAGDLRVGDQGPIVYIIQAHFENTGVTTATHCDAGVTYELVAKNSESVLFSEDAIRSRESSTVGPRLRLVSQHSIQVDELSRLFREEVEIFALARIEYLDVFGKPHHAQICAKIGLYNDPKLVITFPNGQIQPTMHFSIWREHNSSS